MLWEWTLFVTHFCMFIGLVLLCRQSPDPMQLLVMLNFLVAAAIHTTVFGHEAILGERLHWVWTLIAHRIEHVGVFLYVLRVFVNEQERRCLPTSWPNSQQSLR